MQIASTARHCRRIAIDVKHIFFSLHFVRRDGLQNSWSDVPPDDCGAKSSAAITLDIVDLR
jgi:hypothetical protein